MPPLVHVVIYRRKSVVKISTRDKLRIDQILPFLINVAGVVQLSFRVDVYRTNPRQSLIELSSPIKLGIN